ncbi:hypothetical protein [Klebsiella pneumoniae]
MSLQVSLKNSFRLSTYTRELNPSVFSPHMCVIA